MKKLLLIAIMSVSSAALAKSYGEAGCGLGNQLMGKDNQIFAATTNGTSGNQTFGITSGTSNCTDGGAVKSAKAVPLFIEVNRFALAKDAARGQGETLAGLASIMGCEAKNLGSALKSNYNQVFVQSNMEADKIESSMNTLVNANRAAVCGSEKVASL